VLGDRIDEECSYQPASVAKNPVVNSQLSLTAAIQAMDQCFESQIESALERSIEPLVEVKPDHVVSTQEKKLLKDARESLKIEKEKRLQSLPTPLSTKSNSRKRATTPIADDRLCEELHSMLVKYGSGNSVVMNQLNVIKTAKALGIEPKELCKMMRQLDGEQ